MPKEALIVMDNIRDHQPNDGKDYIFSSKMKRTSTNLDGSSSHGSPTRSFSPCRKAHLDRRKYGNTRKAEKKWPGVSLWKGNLPNPRAVVLSAWYGEVE